MACNARRDAPMSALPASWLSCEKLRNSWNVLQRWYRILSEALRYFLKGRKLEPPIRLNPSDHHCQYVTLGRSRRDREAIARFRLTGHDAVRLNVLMAPADDISSQDDATAASSPSFLRSKDVTYL